MNRLQMDMYDNLCDTYGESNVLDVLLVGSSKLREVEEIVNEYKMGTITTLLAFEKIVEVLNN